MGIAFEAADRAITSSGNRKIESGGEPINNFKQPTVTSDLNKENFHRHKAPSKKHNGSSERNLNKIISSELPAPETCVKRSSRCACACPRSL